MYRKLFVALTAGVASLYGVAIPITIYAHHPAGILLLIMIGVMTLGMVVNHFLPHAPPVQGWKRLLVPRNIPMLAAAGSAGYLFGKADHIGMVALAKQYMNAVSPCILLIPISALALAVIANYLGVTSAFAATNEKARDVLLYIVSSFLFLTLVANLYGTVILCMGALIN